MIQVDGAECRLIGTEEHYVPSQYVRANKPLVGSLWDDLDIEDLAFFLFDQRGKPWFDPLSDVGDGRIATMDRAGIDVALLSTLAPGVQAFRADEGAALARDMNDELSALVRDNPRLGGFGLFCPTSPSRAAVEVQRCVRELGLNGLIVYSHTGGEYLDDPKFWEIFEACEALGAPLYIHPRNPPSSLRRLLQNHKGEKVLASGIWGFAMETSLHAVRLLVSGVFDRFPRLKIVLGHLGEGLPYWLYRLDYMYERGYRRQGNGAAKRLPSEYFRDNFFVTVSGIHEHPGCSPTLRFCRDMVGADRLMFASDHPFQSAERAAEALLGAGMAPGDVRAIAHLNAERVFCNMGRFVEGPTERAART